MSLPFADRSDWVWRWLVTPAWLRLHRVVGYVERDDDEMMGVSDAVTACGLRRPFLRMPGMLSRMMLPRCKHCCRKLGVVDGAGAPYNSGMHED